MQNNKESIRLFCFRGKHLIYSICVLRSICVFLCVKMHLLLNIRKTKNIFLTSCTKMIILCTYHVSFVTYMKLPAECQRVNKKLRRRRFFILYLFTMFKSPFLSFWETVVFLFSFFWTEVDMVLRFKPEHTWCIPSSHETLHFFQIINLNPTSLFLYISWVTL